MAPLKAKLKAAQQAYVQQDFARALADCNSALQDNAESPDLLLYAAMLSFIVTVMHISSTLLATEHQSL